ncbi:hypothetical protein K227x_44950 [Rubripirellula lacrimiformis]|uniref:SprT-like family protein n=1 Tax=Rubripirellula lacrimiformis TaxID=1930273 RepID=A0A517NG79_9BACT|nr:hypothetical protein [Rubripirellula lacrimiformis]QDT06088.1 hypothetical protein K227x_44950 [Rubripirellula lacrimiformis]
MTNTDRSVDDLLQSFAPEDPLRGRVHLVLTAIPEEVQIDFLRDPRFSITKLHFEGGFGTKLYIAFPSPDGTGSRCVALKPRLSDCAEPFGLYIIAHELAHAYLRNGPWGDVADPEDAADALAAHWGFPKPIDIRW